MRGLNDRFLLEALEGQAGRDEKGITVQNANLRNYQWSQAEGQSRNVSQTPTLQYSVAGDVILVRFGTKSHSEKPVSTTKSASMSFNRVPVSVPLP